MFGGICPRAICPMFNGKRLDTGNLNPTHAVVLITPMHQRKRGIVQEQSTVPNRNTAVKN